MDTAISLVEQSRFNMVEQQIRPAEVLDPAVLEALLKVKREFFVPPQYQNVAFSDIEIPLEINGTNTHESMLCPRIEARLAQELQLKSTDCVLEIGTGSGYQAALLANLSQQVLSVEINSDIAEFAKSNLKRNGIDNVKVEIGDGRTGWGSAEYNAILLSGSLPSIPDSLKYQLSIGGRLVIVSGQAHCMTAVRITRIDAAKFQTESLFDTVIKPLCGSALNQFKF